MGASASSAAAVRGWTADGVPTPERLRTLELAELVGNGK